MTKAQVLKRAKQYGWCSVELDHALGYRDCKYGAESIVRLGENKAVHCPAYPAPCDYVRIVQGGCEIAYWDRDEWRDEPAEVMGAIMGAMRE